MGSLLNKAVRLLSKNWKKLAKPFAAVIGLLGAAGIGGFIERRRAEKREAKQKKVIRKHEAALRALQSQDEQSLLDKRKIKKLEAELEDLRAQLASVDETTQNA